MKSDKAYIFIGLLLFEGYLLQYYLHLRWEVLGNLQQLSWYKLSSGTLLLLLILVQWHFSKVRANPKTSAQKSILHYNLHNWLGALSPLVFYLHTIVPGYAYLLVLSILFLGNFMLGILNNYLLPVQGRWYHNGWMVLHVSISCLITTLVLVHIVVVFYYE